MNYKNIQNSELGYEIVQVLNKDELADVQSIISKKIYKAAIDSGVTVLNNFDWLMENYKDGIHASIAKKERRIFSVEEAEKFLQITNIANIVRRFPNCSIGPVTYGEGIIEKRPEVYFRVSRPNNDKDVGPIHCDRWFNEVFSVSDTNQQTFKVWLSINTEPGKNGLLISPGSHKKTWCYDKVQTENGPKPVPKFTANSVQMYLPEIRSGEAIIFHDRLLHGGAQNNGRYPRVSIEFWFEESVCHK
jgi:hypothetical protein